MKKEIKYGLKFLGWFFLVIIVLLILAGLLIQTRPVKQKLAKIASSQAEQYLNGNIYLEKIEGNFFTRLQIKDVLWKYESDTVAFIANLDLQYDLRPLLNGHLLVNTVEIHRPFFQLKQENDSTWNIQQLIKSSSSSKSDTTTSGSNFQLNLPTVQLIDGRINFDTADSIIPEQINQLNTDFSFYWNRLHQSVQLKQFSFKSKNPDVILTQLIFNVSRDTSMIDLTNFQLKTQQNQLNGKGTFQPQEKQATATFRSAPLQPGEFKFLLPDIKMPASPEFNLDASIENDSLKATIGLADKEQKIHLNFSSANFIDFLSNPSHVRLNYQLDGKLENIDLAHWTGNSQLDYLVNGNLTAQGIGTEPKTAVVTLKGDFSDCMVKNNPLDELTVDINLDHGNIKGWAEGSGDFGKFNVRPDIQNLFDTPAYQFELTTQKFNLAEILGNDSLQSDINLEANVTGSGFKPEELTAKAQLNVSQSQFQSLRIDTILADAEYKMNNFQIDSIGMKSNSVWLKAHGNYALQSNSEIWLTARFDSISDFKAFIPVNDLQSSGIVKAHLQGTLDSMNLESTVQLDSTSYNAFFLDGLTLNATAKTNQTDTIINASLQAYHLQNKKWIIDSVLVNAEANSDSMIVDGRVVGNDMRSVVKGRLNWQEQLRITLENWMIDYKNQHLALQSSPAVIEIDTANYRIHNFKMASNDSDTAQYISLAGKISRNANEDLSVKADNIDVAQIMEMLDSPVKSTGLASFNLSVAGTPVSPVLKGDFGISNAMLNTYNFTDFGGTLSYKNNELALQTKIVPADSGRIELNGMLPLQIALDSFNFNFNPKDSVDLKLNVDKFPLAIVQTFDVSGNIAGFIDGDVNVTGTAESPNPTGELKLVNASVNMPEYGVDYHNILFNLSFLRNNIRLDTLRIETSDGDVSGNGKIDFASDFYKGNISKSQINLNFDQFNPVDHRQFNMQVSGNTSLGGKKGDVVFDGDLNIPEAEVYLPAILNMMGEIYVPEIPKPVLVQALEKHNNVPDSLQITIQPKDTTKQFNLDYFDDLTGKLRIKIPKNTWVKNEDLRLELSGDFELIKHKTFTEIFGSANVVRGQYDMFGRTFVIDEGSISFEGGEELMPMLNLTASYTFRDPQRQEKKLTVKITGNANSPSVDFNLDASAVSEGDALSYILFGKSMNELSMDQQSNLNGAGGGQLAENAAASILSAQISNFLSKKLNVDYIEVKSDGGFDNATVVVGKYLTNDLFVSYEQRFGTTDQEDISKYKVTLEYELFKFLFFQLNNSSTNSGFDVIFKVNSK